MNVEINIITALALTLTVFILYLYIYLADNRNVESPPDEVITLKFEFTNIFLIPTDEGYVLIDNAYEKEFDKFIGYLDEHHIGLQDIKYILLTHHHDDHVGFLNPITSANPDVRIILHKKTAKLVATGHNNKENGGGLVNRRVYFLFRIKQILSPEWDLSFPPYTVRERDIIIENDFLDLKKVLGIDIQAFHTPGHSSDSVTYIYKDKYAFCGDLASNFLNWAGARYLTLFNEDIDMVYDSWRALIDKDVEVIMTAHGKPFHIKNLKKNLDYYDQEDIVEFF